MGHPQRLQKFSLPSVSVRIDNSEATNRYVKRRRGVGGYLNPGWMKSSRFVAREGCRICSVFRPKGAADDPALRTWSRNDRLRPNGPTDHLLARWAVGTIVWVHESLGCAQGWINGCPFGAFGQIGTESETMAPYPNRTFSTTHLNPEGFRLPNLASCTFFWHAGHEPSCLGTTRVKQWGQSDSMGPLQSSLRAYDPVKYRRSGFPA